MNSNESAGPQAVAEISGGGISGTVMFYDYPLGVLTVTDIHGLPKADGVYAFHIHTGSSCEGMNYSDADGHYNPTNSLHPYHAGDLPPLFSNNGNALMAVRTGRFTIDDIEGRAIVIHENPDDFTTQPSGNSGKIIACGLIHRI